MPSSEKQELHLPLPWRAHALMIVDATGTQVLHLGGSRDGHGRMMDPFLLEALARLIVEAVNGQPRLDPPPSNDARDETIRQLHERIDEQNRIHLEIYQECDRELTAAGIPYNVSIGSDEPHCVTSKRISMLAQKLKEERDRVRGM